MKRALRHTLTFLMCGTLAFCVDMLVFYGFVVSATLATLVARPIAIAIAMLAGWWLHRTFSFPQTGEATFGEFVAYVGTASSAALVNYLCFIFLNVFTGFPPIWSAFGGAVCAMAVSYSGMRLYVFK